MRILFATDVHGSEVCFRKFLNARTVYEPDVMIIGGDITGKALIPIVGEGDDFQAMTAHGPVDVAGREAITAYERQAADQGSYTWRCTSDEYETSRQDPRLVFARFHAAVLARVEAWCALAAERMAREATALFVSGGNDDFWEVDEVLNAASRVECPDRRIVTLDRGVQMLSCGLANETPWGCPRDVSESELEQVIDELAEALAAGPAVFNLHAPPFDTEIDAGPALDRQGRPRMGLGGIEQTPVGSRAVRDAIVRYEPALSLHGHVHESAGVRKLGDTVAINPGSEYSQGLLRGAVIDFRRGKVRRHQLICG